jgi:uncharacterized protein (UPF0333 family)
MAVSSRFPIEKSDFSMDHRTKRRSVAPVLGFGGCRKGQASLELLVTLGVVIAFTVPVIFLLLSVSSVGYENAAKDQADATARTLADSINIVYAQGDGAKRIVLVNSPSATEKIEIKKNEVAVKIGLSEGTYEGVSPVFANVSKTDAIENRSGLYEIILDNEGGQVVISYEK